MTCRDVDEANVFPELLDQITQTTSLLKLFGGDVLAVALNHSISPLGGATHWHRQFS